MGNIINKKKGGVKATLNQGIGETMANKEICICKKTITKYNTRHYKAFCCRRYYNKVVREDGQKTADATYRALTNSMNRINNKINKIKG